jgi:hypothetical protein
LNPVYSTLFGLVFVFATTLTHLLPLQHLLLPLSFSHPKKTTPWTVLTAALISNEAQIAEMSNNVTNTTTGSSNISSGDDKLQTNSKSTSEIAMEVRQLREEESKLRLENMQLRVSAIINHYVIGLFRFFGRNWYLGFVES